MANNLNVANVDFDQIKSAYKSYLKANSIITDMDYEGSAINTILDILSYNTFYNAVYLNNVSNEMFIDSAQLRSSVVSLANYLSYTPKSYTCSRVFGTLVITPAAKTTDTILIPAGYKIITKIDNTIYTFQTMQTNIAAWNVDHYEANVTFYEGKFVTNTWIVNTTNLDQEFVIQNKNIDTDTIQVSVITNGNNLLFTKFSDFSNVSATTNLYFIKENDLGFYQLDFGDGYTGRKLSNNDIIQAQYLACSGPIPNGASTFSTQTSISGISNVVFIPADPAYGGSYNESIESIRTKSVKSFSTQNRLVSYEDYESAVLSKYQFVESVSTWGGEDNEPPMYGRVFLSIKPVSGFVLSNTQKEDIKSFITSKNVATIIPEFTDPDYIFMKVISDVRYDSSKTSISESIISTLAKNSILDYFDNDLEKFDANFRYSRLIEKIDNSYVAIVSNITSVKIGKYINIVYNQAVNYDVILNYAIIKDSLEISPVMISGHSSQIFFEISDTDNAAVSSIKTFEFVGSVKQYLNKVGTVHWETGNISIPELNITQSTQEFKIFASPIENDIIVNKNKILSIKDQDITITTNSI